MSDAKPNKPKKIQQLRDAVRNKSIDSDVVLKRLGDTRLPDPYVCRVTGVTHNYACRAKSCQFHHTAADNNCTLASGIQSKEMQRRIEAGRLKFLLFFLRCFAEVHNVPRSLRYDISDNQCVTCDNEPTHVVSTDVLSREVPMCGICLDKYQKGYRLARLIVEISTGFRAKTIVRDVERANQVVQSIANRLRVTEIKR